MLLANFKPKRTAAASRGFFATGRISCTLSSYLFLKLPVACMAWLMFFCIFNTITGQVVRHKDWSMDKRSDMPLVFVTLDCLAPPWYFRQNQWQLLVAIINIQNSHNDIVSNFWLAILVVQRATTHQSCNILV